MVSAYINIKDEREFYPTETREIDQIRCLVHIDERLLAFRRLSSRSDCNPKRNSAFDAPTQLPVHLHRNWSDHTRPHTLRSLTDVRLCCVRDDWHLGINNQRSLTRMFSQLQIQFGLRLFVHRVEDSGDV